MTESEAKSTDESREKIHAVSTPHGNSGKLQRFAVVYFLFAIAASMVLLIPEGTEDPTHWRIIFSIWATTLFLIPTVIFFFFSDVSRRIREYWYYFATSAFLLYLIHFFYAVVVHFDGLRGTFRGQGYLIATGNFLLTLIWSIDLLMMWTVSRIDYRSWNRHLYSLLVVVVAFLFFSIIRNDGVVRWIGVSLALGTGLSIYLRWRHAASMRNRQIDEDQLASPKEEYFRGSLAEETRYFHGFVDQINHVQRRTQNANYPSPIRRALHAKRHVAVNNAEFRVLEDLPNDLKVGLFEKPNRFTASIRISNAASTERPDGEKDLRGFAIRIHLDEHNAHDFLGTNAPSSHARDAYQFMALLVAISKPFRILLPFRLLFSVGPYEMIRMFLILFRSRTRVPSVLAETYWSRSAIRVGNTAARYAIVPRNSPVSALQISNPNYLRAEALKQLAQGDVEFDFVLQAYVDEKRTPIEDSSIEWSESVSQPVVVARIRLPKQTLGSAETDAMEASIDDLAFNPWRTTPELRPLGSQNRARLAVYKSSSDFRRKRKRSEMHPWFVSIPMYLLIPIFRVINLIVPWYKLPFPVLEILNLNTIRHTLRQYNLHDPEFSNELLPSTRVDAFRLDLTRERQSDGTYNDLTSPNMGKVESIFGRNVPLEKLTPPTPQSVLSPNPRLISRQLHARESFIPATTLNIAAAAWIQFQVHGWFNHTKLRSVFRSNEYWDVELADDDPWRTYEQVMRIPKTPIAGRTSNGVPTFANTETHWWDASQVYGNSKEETGTLRLFERGYLKLDGDLLPVDPRIKFAEFDLTGFNDNYWVGLSLFHTIFAKEHNAICDALCDEYPNRSQDDEWLFQKARLVNAALMTKIHTVEWTPGILGRQSLSTGMRANWWGLLGEGFANAFGRMSESEEVSGIVGSFANHHAAPYALTEDFVTVYRMHPLIPDEYLLCDLQGKQPSRVLDFAAMNSVNTRKVMKENRVSDLWYSLGVAHPGAITLKNYPNQLRNLVVNEGRRIDLATIDNLRDRERALPRYNDFRRNLRMKPIKRWKDITNDPALAEQIRDLYGGDLEKVDTMVGLHAETPPPGFGFSDTAFRVFILMASRRLKSDRFYTNDYNALTYTKVGLEWIRDNLMTDVLLRHYPELEQALAGISNAFAPWNRNFSKNEDRDQPSSFNKGDTR